MKPFATYLCNGECWMTMYSGHPSCFLVVVGTLHIGNIGLMRRFRGVGVTSNCWCISDTNREYVWCKLNRSDQFYLADFFHSIKCFPSNVAIELNIVAKSSWWNCLNVFQRLKLHNESPIYRKATEFLSSDNRSINAECLLINRRSEGWWAPCYLVHLLHKRRTRSCRIFSVFMSFRFNHLINFCGPRKQRTVADPRGVAAMTFLRAQTSSIRGAAPLNEGTSKVYRTIDFLLIHSPEPYPPA